MHLFLIIFFISVLMRSLFSKFRPKKYPTNEEIAKLIAENKALIKKYTQKKADTLIQEEKTDTMIQTWMSDNFKD